MAKRCDALRHRVIGYWQCVSAHGDWHGERLGGIADHYRYGGSPHRWGARGDNPQVAVSRWQVDLLSYLSAPNTGGNVDVLTMWADSEQVAGWANNWLATTWKTLDSIPYNDKGVQAYPDQFTGVEATGDTLLDSDPIFGYGLIVLGLRNDFGPNFQMWDYINKSSWCSGCDGGFYPNVFYAYLQGTNQIETGVSAGAGAGVAIIDPATLAPGAKAAWDAFRSFQAQGAQAIGGQLIGWKQAIDQLT